MDCQNISALIEDARKLLDDAENGMRAGSNDALEESIEEVMEKCRVILKDAATLNR